MTTVLLNIEEGFERYEPLAEIVNTAIAAAVRAGSGPEKVQIGLLITGDEQIRELNRTYRGVDSATDVLSFPLLEAGQAPTQADIDPETGEVLLGDIVLSLPTAERQAADYGHSLAREAAYLAVHGTLHLLGQDHEDEVAREAMRRDEEAVLASVGLTREG